MNKVKEEILKEFEKQFFARPFESDGDWGFTNKANPREMRAYFSSALDTYARQICRGVMPEEQNGSHHGCCEIEGWNSCRSQFLCNVDELLPEKET